MGVCSVLPCSDGIYLGGEGLTPIRHAPLTRSVILKRYVLMSWMQSPRRAWQMASAMQADFLTQTSTRE